MIRKSGLFDYAVLNTDDEMTKRCIESTCSQRTVLFDFGARTNVAPTWHTTLFSSPTPSTLITIGGEVKPQDTEMQSSLIAPLLQVNANLLREKGIDSSGEDYLEVSDRAGSDSKEISRA
jgi:hypothetical protein